MMRFERQVLVPASLTRVWEAFTDPDQLSTWFGAEGSIEARPGGRATFRFPDGSERVAVVETVDPPRLLIFRWLPFHRAGGGRTRHSGGGRVRIRLEPSGDGTRVTVVETGRDRAGLQEGWPGPLASVQRPSSGHAIRAGLR
jgi:uncharacterized protein YndB with AHSA1/START domain